MWKISIRERIGLETHIKLTGWEIYIIVYMVGDMHHSVYGGRYASGKENLGRYASQRTVLDICNRQ